MKTFFVDGHGCAKNQIDSELLIGHLQDAGLMLCQDAKKADYIIVNSCSFIQEAKQESLEAVFQAKKDFPQAKIILAGCMAQRYAKELKEELPETDAIFGNGDLSKIKDVVQQLEEKKRPIIIPLQQGICCGKRPIILQYKNQCFLKIAEGCDNHCSFCAIPLIRGELRSRKIEEIVQEMKELLQKGMFEINLIAQDLAAFGQGKQDSGETLKELLEEISKLEGKFWLRLLYIHPDHFDFDILPLMKKDERLLPYFDIPFQTGSDTLIKKMNRKGTKQGYIDMMRRIRSELGDIALRTTFLTGFPSETQEDAKETANFLQEIQSDWSGTFCYSKEEGTPAYSMKGKVSRKIAKKRQQDLCSLQQKITQKKLQQRCNKTYDVLIEEVIPTPDEKGLAIGRAWFCAPEVDGNIVLEYDKDNDKAKKEVKEGNVVRAFAYKTTDLDICAYYVC